MRRSAARAGLLIALMLIAGCASTSERSCFVGLSLIPPSPILICGVDVSKKTEE